MQCVHRLPKTRVPVSSEGPSSSQLLKRSFFPHRFIALNIVEHAGLQHEKPPVDPRRDLALGLFHEVAHPVAVLGQIEYPEAAWLTHRRERSLNSGSAVLPNGRLDINIAYTVAVGKAKRLITYVLAHPAQAPTRHGSLASVYQRDRPRLDVGMMHLHLVAVHAKRDVAVVQEIVGKVLLYHVPFVAAAHHKFGDAVVGIYFHDVPNDGFTPNLNHWFWPHPAFFTDACAVPAG